MVASLVARSEADRSNTAHRPVRAQHNALPYAVATFNFGSHCGTNMTMRQDRKPPPPIDAATLDRLALRYVERYATTRGKLRDYLTRKIRERGWAGDTPADVAALADRMAELGYVDDRSFAEARVGAMGRRGLGARRIAGELRAAGIESEDSEAVQPTIADQAEASAIAFARRRRIGPFARDSGDDGPTDRATLAKANDKALSAMLRAGHGFDRARRILAMTPDDVERYEAETYDRG